MANQQGDLLVDGDVVQTTAGQEPASARLISRITPLLSFILFLGVMIFVAVDFVTNSLRDTTAIEATIVAPPLSTETSGENAVPPPLLRASNEAPPKVEFVITDRSHFDLAPEVLKNALPPLPRLSTDPAPALSALRQAEPPLEIAILPSGSKRTWPRLKPEPPVRFRAQQQARLSYSQKIAKPIRLSAQFVAEDKLESFSDLMDFTGGRDPIFSLTPDQPTQISDDEIAPTTVLTLGKSETLSDAMIRIGIHTDTIRDVANALNKKLSVRRLRPGMAFTLRTTPLADTSHLDILSLEIAQKAGSLISVTKTPNGYTSQLIKPKAELRYASVSGSINSSLFASAGAVGVPNEIIAKLANLFLYDVDFQRDIRRGDKFGAVFEVYYDEYGNLVRYGDVVYGRLSWKAGRREKGYYRYTVNNRVRWFDAEGQSAKRLLMKTPIEGARVTSSFGRRKHPVLGYTKQHKGVDFGARRGTPIMAAGDGKIMRANRFGSFGNYVKIKHANGYETAYAHLKGFAKGIRKGKSVEQGQIIGYVGTTGRSTGPHLHYEVLKRGRQVNPMTLDVSRGQSLKGKDLARFKQQRDWIEDMREPAALVSK